MWEKFFQAIKDFVFQSELSRRNAEEIRELRKRNEEITLLVERLAFEVQRVRENEGHEREKLMLRLELLSRPQKRQLPKKKPR